MRAKHFFFNKSRIEGEILASKIHVSLSVVLTAVRFKFVALLLLVYCLLMPSPCLVDLCLVLVL